jgi:hypothetical protein
MRDLFSHRVSRPTDAEGDMTAATGTVELVDVRDTLPLVFWTGVPGLDLDVLYLPAALVRSVQLKLFEEPSSTRSHSKDLLERVPWTSQNMKAVQRFPSECPRCVTATVVADRRDVVFVHA